MESHRASRRVKAAAIFAAGGILTAGAAFGARAFAQTPSPSPTPNSQQQQHQAEETQFLNDLAANLNVSPTALTNAIKQTQEQEVAKQVQAGTLTQAEADAIDHQIEASNPPSLGPGGGGRGRGGPGGGLLFQQVPGLQPALDNAFQQTVGETRQQFMQNVMNGKTPAQEFQAHNTTAQAVATDETNAAKPLLDQAVQQGKITQQQETDFLTHLQNDSGEPSGFGGPPRAGGNTGSGGSGAATGTPSSRPQVTATPASSQ